MLTCINPDVSFSTDKSNIRVRGAAISLNCLWNLITMSGHAPPIENIDRLKQEIEELEIGATKKRKQFFNKTPNGTKIKRTRTTTGTDVEVISKKCVIIKHSAFGAASWAVFSEGNVNILFASFINFKFIQTVRLRIITYIYFFLMYCYIIFVRRKCLVNISCCKK